MRVFQKDIFGPVVRVTTFKDEVEAVAIVVQQKVIIQVGTLLRMIGGRRREAGRNRTGKQDGGDGLDITLCMHTA